MGKLTIRLGACALIFLSQRGDCIGENDRVSRRQFDRGLRRWKRARLPGVNRAENSRGQSAFDVDNAGVSGDTSADGLHRIDWLFQRPIDMLVIALGANDGLRGLPANVLKQISRRSSTKRKRRIRKCRKSSSPECGCRQTSARIMKRNFSASLAAVAEKNHAVLIPFLLEGRRRKSRAQPTGFDSSDRGRSKSDRGKRLANAAAVAGTK